MKLLAPTIADQGAGVVIVFEFKGSMAGRVLRSINDGFLSQRVENGPYGLTIAFTRDAGKADKAIEPSAFDIQLTFFKIGQPMLVQQALLPEIVRGEGPAKRPQPPRFLIDSLKDTTGH